MTTLLDADARRRIQQDLDANFVVEAAAGTGKTTALVGRIVAVVQAGLTTLDRIVAVTFTEKAAGEMKLRLRTELERARERANGPAERAHLERALSALEVTHINTIHGFCSDLLRERPIEAGIDPAFRVLDEVEANKLIEQAFQRWFEGALSNIPEGMRRILRRRSWRDDGMPPRAQLLRAVGSLIEHRDFTAPWTRPKFDREQAIDDLVQRFGVLGALQSQARSPNDPLARALGNFRDWVERIEAAERVRARDYDGIEASLVRFERDHERAFTQKGHGALFGQNLDRNAVFEQRSAAQVALGEFLALAEADLAARLRAELTPVVLAYQSLKRTQGVVDFVDLLLYTRNLLQNDARIRSHLQARFTHLFVDEFQDTDPLQAEILLLLAADAPGVSDYRQARARPGKLFVVGDPKQSIYRFRRADVAFFQKIKRDLLGQGAQLLQLTTNFRSLPTIQAAVNQSFSHCMAGTDDGTQVDYVPLTPHREAIAEQPAVVALPIPEPYGLRGELTKTAVNASYPDAVGAFVHWLLSESHWRVAEGAELVPVKARHVCLLFRRFQHYDTDLTQFYVRGLEARGIPHVLVGGRSFHGREEVMAVRTALEAIEWPDDELSVYATLRGSLFGITDEELLCFRNEFARLSPLRRVDDAARERHPDVTDALELLRSLHFSRNRRPIADTVEQLLSETRAHAAFAMWPTGEQALANALSIVDLARTLESRGISSFRGFLEALTAQAEQGQGSEAPVIEEGTEGVRLMTVHKAKGLEFPIVILCDPTAPIESKRATRHVDIETGVWAQAICGCRPLELQQSQSLACRHEEAESVRLAYVAATRARDLLVVPSFGDASAENVNVGWMDTMAPALYPSKSARSTAHPAPGCPTFGADSVLARPAATEARPDHSVAPGLHYIGEHHLPIVWWDPKSLKLKVEPIRGVRQQELLAEPLPGNDGGIQAHAEWQQRHHDTLQFGQKPSVAVVRITDLAKQLTEPVPEARLERTSVERQARPRGPRFGTLVHALLEEIALDAEASAIERLARTRARLLGATDEERSAAVAAVTAALSHPLMQRARTSSDLRREAPVMAVRADGTIVEGIVDLAFRDEEGWLVLDFKTDEQIREPQVYAAQLALYVDAIARATGEAARGALLMV